MTVNRDDARALISAVETIDAKFSAKEPTTDITAAIADARVICKRLRSQLDALGRGEREGKP